MAGLLWFLLWAGLFVVMMRFGCGAHMAHGDHGGDGSHLGHQRPDAGAAKVAAVDAMDPVCGMPVAVDQGYAEVYQGRLLRFCSRKCLDTFDAAPQQYAG